MKQVFNNRGKIVIKELPKPSPKAGFVVVKTAYSVISTGSELQALHERSKMIQRAIKSPKLLKDVSKKLLREGISLTYKKIKEKLGEIPLGYSCSGEVIEKNKVDDVNVGDYVACGGAGYANHAEINCIPKNLVVRIPYGVDLKDAAFVSMGAIALQSVRRCKAEIGENIAVIGLGLIGQLVSQILNANSCHVIGIDIDDKRIKIAKQNGIHAIKGKNLKNKIASFTKRYMVDKVIICASSKNYLKMNPQ